MASGTYVQDNIPTEDDADMVVAGFNAQQPPPTSVAKAQNADGSWKVTAVFP